MPDKLCLLVPLIIFYSHFTDISKNFTTPFVNYVSIKTPQRGRQDNVICLQQGKARFLLTAIMQKERVRGGKPASKGFTEDEERLFFSPVLQGIKKKKIRGLTRQSVGKRPEHRYSYSFSSIAATKSNKLSFTSNFPHKYEVVSAKSPNYFCDGSNSMPTEGRLVLKKKKGGREY